MTLDSDAGHPVPSERSACVFTYLLHVLYAEMIKHNQKVCNIRKNVNEQRKEELHSTALSSLNGQFKQERDPYTSTHQEFNQYDT